jgi:hypothetical protein
LLEQALAIFEDLGTIDEPPRVRAALAELTAEGRLERETGRTGERGKEERP